MISLIRGFLWTLAGVMTLQGFLHADEFGTATSMWGGVSLTMAVMKESVGTWSPFSATPAFVPLPRVVVQAALKETALHPGIQVVPKLQQTLKIHQRTWDLFRDKEVAWMLEHADLIGGLMSDPDARQIWTVWDERLNYSEGALSRLRTCRVRALDPEGCDATATEMARYEKRVRQARHAARAWVEVLYLSRGLSARAWWGATHPETNTSDCFGEFAAATARLHDIEGPGDPRIAAVGEMVRRAAVELGTDESEWIQRLVGSLLTGEMWSSCMEHVRLREGRVRDLMMVAGIRDMEAAHERVLNASLRVVSDADRRMVQDWFGEMAGYAWWLSDAVPSLVRRCISQEAGDCTRIGPTEIVALTAKFAERERIVGNWVRRIYIGMWNAMPVVGILFVLELVLLCVDRRAPPFVVNLEERPKPAVPTLTNG